MPRPEPAPRPVPAWLAEWDAWQGAMERWVSLAGAAVLVVAVATVLVDEGRSPGLTGTAAVLGPLAAWMVRDAWRGHWRRTFTKRKEG